MHAIDLLAEVFPDAKFVALIRDPFSWVNSQVNFFTMDEHQALEREEVPSGFPFDLPRGANEAKSELIRHLPRYIEGIIAHWANSVRAMLAQLPPDRSLVVRTNDITRRVDDLARFVGVPVETLRRDSSHLNSVRYHIDALRQCDRELLRSLFDAHCRELVATYFPECSLDRFWGTR